MTHARSRGVSVAEFLVAVALAGSLAAATVPELLEAQTRSKYSQTRSVLREVGVALGNYAIDNGPYPYDGYNAMDVFRYNYWYLSLHLSTPVAYLPSSQVTDPFRRHLLVGDLFHHQVADIRYRNIDSTWGVAYDGMQVGSHGFSVFYPQVMAEYGGWVLTGVGPDGTYGPTGWPGVSSYPTVNVPYDPTNGALSTGDISRSELSLVGHLNIPQ